ncbi:MAG: hypothetical protein K2K03_10410 [Prevotella sp.]|nr:hypothetical protein [Prevotella sp.]
MGVALSPDLLRTMHGRTPHHVPRPSASCADLLRIMHGYAPHHVPMRSALCAARLRTVCRASLHILHR